MEKDVDSSAMESKDSDCETVYVITEEELNNSFISENIGKEIIIDGSFFIVGENSFSLDGQDIQLQDKENMDGKELISVVLEKNDSNTVDNSGNVYGSLINNDNENVTTRNENSFIDKNQPTTVNHEQNILSGHSQNSYMDVEENLSLDSVEDSSIVHHQEKVTTPGKNCILSVSGHVQLQPSDWDMLTCPYCMTNFSKAYIMKRHMVTVHKFLSSEAPFPCFYCNALCQQEDLLLKHYEIEHKYQQQTALLITRMYSADPHRFVCSYCPKKFAKPCHLKKHLEIKHNFTSDEVAFPCGFKSCKMSFEKQILLLKHYEKEHNQKEQTALESTENNGDALPSEVASDRDNEIEILSQIKSRTDKLKSSEPIPASKKNIGRIKCIECNVNCTSFRTFREHLLKYHKLDVTEKEIRFPNMTAFKKWKLEIERRDLTFFTAQMGAKKLQNYFWRQYCCHRSGYYKQGNKVKKSRMDNLLGSCKTGFFCTASMTVREYPDEVHVKYCLQHYGHGGGTTFVHLSDEEQAAVQENLYNGIPLEEQLNDIKDTQSSAEHFQACIKKKRDISFLNKAYSSEVYYSGMSAGEYVEQWVRICSEMEDSPILLYRQEASGTKSDNLMLIIMTEFQKHILMTSTKQIVCLACPNRIKRGRKLLTTLIIIDDQDAAFPVAFCISNRINKSSMLEFLSSVRESTGPLSCLYFMSNDDKFFFEAWQEVMQDESKWVWSTWSLDDRIRKILAHPKTTIKDINTREATYRLFRKIMECNSQPVFSTMFKNFKISLLENPLTNDFGKYFVSHYDSNPEMWACCYRKDVKLSTNIFIEFLNKTLKYCIKITKTKQLDKLLMVLMKWLRYKMLDRLSNMLDEDKIDMVKNTISMCHNKGLEIECENIVSLSDKIWLIRSQNEANVYVTQDYESCPELCDLRCFDCDVCVHMYSCSCVQSLVLANMCQHVHAVVWKFLTPHFSPPTSPVAKPCDNVDDIDADVQIIPDKEPDILKSVLKRMQGVYKQVRINKCKLSKKSLVEALRLLNRCYQICSSDEDYSHPVEKSTQTEYFSRPDIVKSTQTEYLSESEIVKATNHVLKGLDNNMSISYPSSVPVMAFGSVLNPVRRSCHLKSNSTSVSMPSSKSILKPLNNTVSSSSGRHKIIDTFKCGTSSCTNLNDSSLDSAFDRDQTDLLHVTANILSSPPKQHKRFKPIAPTPAPIETPLDRVLRKYSIQRRDGSNFLQVLSPNNSSDKVDKISIIPIIPSKSTSNSKTVTKEHHLERTNVSDDLLMKDSSNISNSPMINCPSVLKIPASSAENLLPNPAKTVSDSFSSSSPVTKKHHIERISVSEVPIMKDSSNICDNSVTNCPLVIKTSASPPDNSIPVSAKTVPDSFSNSGPVAKKRHIEKTNVSDVPVMKDSSNVCDNSMTNCPLVIQTSASPSDNLLPFSAKTVSDSFSNSGPVAKKRHIEITSVLSLPLIKDSSNDSDSYAKNSFLSIKNTVSSSSNLPVDTISNSVPLASSITESTSSCNDAKNHPDFVVHPTDQELNIALPDVSVNSVLQTPSVVKPSTEVSISESNKHRFDMIKHSSNQVSNATLPDVSTDAISNSVLQVPSLVKSTAVSVSASKNHSEVKTYSTSHISCVATSNAFTDAASSLVSQTSLVKFAAMPNFTVNNNSDVKTNFSNQILQVGLPDTSVNTVSNSVSQTALVMTPSAMTSSEIFYVAIPNASVNTQSNSTSQTSSNVKSTAASANEIFYVAVPNASVNTLSNSISQVSSDVKSTTTSANEIFYLAVPNASVSTGSNSISQISSDMKSTAETNNEIFYIALPEASACTFLNSFPQKPFVEKSAVTSASVSKVTSCSADFASLSDVAVTSMPNSGSETLSVLKSSSLLVSVLNNHSDVTAHSSDHPLPVSLPVVSNNDVSLISQEPVIASINTSDKSRKNNQTLITSVDPVPNSISSCSPVVKRFHREITNSSNELLIKGSSDVSSGPVTNSPFIIKATVSSSDNLPVISATNSVSHGSSKIQPSVMLASTTNNNSGVGTCFNDKVCFEKSHDRISNTSNTQLDVTSSVQSCQKESDVSCIITSYYSIKSSSDPVTNSTAEKSDAIRSQPSISIPINQPGSLQYMWEPISKKRYVVKASIPFTPK